MLSSSGGWLWDFSVVGFHVNVWMPVWMLLSIFMMRNRIENNSESDNDQEVEKATLILVAPRFRNDDEAQ